MTAPRLEIDLGKIHHNAQILVQQLAVQGIAVMGVTKAVLGSAAIAKEMMLAGVSGLGDSRIENIQSMRGSGIAAPLTMIRSPMLSQVAMVAEHADLSFHSEMRVIREMAAAAKILGKVHGVVLMVELGDLREGMSPQEVGQAVPQILKYPSLALKGIGTNLACFHGIIPDEKKMSELSTLANHVESLLGFRLEMITGGNSANLAWALSEASLGRINHLRLGESILLGRETLHRQPLKGLFTNAITLVAEVIEAKIKPVQPWGQVAQAAFDGPPDISKATSPRRVIFALGRQDTDPSGLSPPRGCTILGASSDHLVVDCGPHSYHVGSQMTFQLNYSALVCSMTSPFVAKVLRQRNQSSSKPMGKQAS